MRESHAPERWGLAEARHGASPAAWGSPLGKAAPASPGRRGQPGAPDIRDERCEAGPMLPGDGSNGGRDPPVLPSVPSLGSRTERWGPGEAHAPSLVLLAAAMRHTGAASVAAQSSGAGVRGQRLTHARGHRGESEGAEESARGNATDPRRRTDGAGPEPVSRGKPRSPVHAQAVHGWTAVELEQWAPTLHGHPMETKHRWGAGCGQSRTPGSQRRAAT
jgi:hypothetical protein